MRSFTKIFQLGHKAIEDIFEGNIEISEKLDGSQFKFYRDDDDFIHTYSKGKEVFHPTTDKLFQPAVDYLNNITIPKGYYFYSETLCRPKHNTIKYDTIPKNHIALFGVYNIETDSFEDHKNMKFISEHLGVDVVPLLFQGELNPAPTPSESLDFIKDILNRESYLGGHKIEGVVVRDIEKAVQYMGLMFPMAIAKYVSEEYKEKHDKNWKNKGHKNQWVEFMEIYRCEARWQKAYQHLRDDGLIVDEPKDIGGLIKEAQRDITDECKDEIMEYLWKIYGKQLLRHSIKGLPEWYKEKLLTDI